MNRHPGAVFSPISNALDYLRKAWCVVAHGGHVWRDFDLGRATSTPYLYCARCGFLRSR